jgi:hypothetical protein
MNSIDVSDVQQLKFNANQNERLELVRQTIAITEKAAFEERKTKKTTTTTKTKIKKEKAVKVAKSDTKELSFALYKLGKMPEEIAQERALGLTTIESHLSHYVSLGMIPVTQFVSKEKFDKIIEASKKIDGENKLTPLKQELGDDFSYSEIKYALATQKHLNT